MEKRKSLLVATDCAYHGTFNIARMVSLGLCGEFDVALAVPYEDGAAEDLAELKRKGVRVVATAASFETLERCVYDRVEAARIIETCSPDVILSCDGAQLFSLLALKELAGERAIPFLTIVNCLSEDPFRQFPEWRERAAHALSSAATVICVSQAIRRRLDDLPEVSGQRVVISNFCSDAFFETGDPSARGRIRSQLNIPADALVGCTIGRIERNKGQHLSLAALKHLVSQGERRCYWLYVGRMEPWERETFEAALEASGARDVVRVLGERSDVRDLLDASDLLALTSYNEGMPLVVAEALARGLPVLATAIDGVVEQIDGSCGVLLPAPEGQEIATVDALRGAIEGLLADPERLGRMRLAARRRGEAFRSAGSVAAYRDAIQAVVRQTLSTRPAAARDVGRSLAPGACLDLTAPEVAWNCLGTGWLRCASDGTPSEGEESELRLRFSAGVDRVRLSLALSPHYGGRYDVDLFAGVVHAGTWRVRKRRHEFSLTLDLRRTGSEMSLFLRPRHTDPWGRALRIHELRVNPPKRTLRERIEHFWRPASGADADQRKAPVGTPKQPM